MVNTIIKNTQAKFVLGGIPESPLPPPSESILVITTLIISPKPKVVIAR